MTLFDVYRHVLILIVLIYCLTKICLFIWNWQIGKKSDSRSESILRRYVEVSILRTRLRRFWPDFVQVAALLVVLWVVVSWHA